MDKALLEEARRVLAGRLPGEKVRPALAMIGEDLRRMGPVAVCSRRLDLIVMILDP